MRSKWVVFVFGCGGQVLPTPAVDAPVPDADTPETISFGNVATEDASMPRVPSGPCTLVFGDAGHEPGQATTQPILIPGDINGSPGMRMECTTAHVQLRIDVLIDGTKGKAWVQTMYGLETGSAICTIDVSQWPYGSSYASTGSFECPPIVMTWGGIVNVSGTFATK